jgi:hypothetical protein
VEGAEEAHDQEQESGRNRPELKEQEWHEQEQERGRRRWEGQERGSGSRERGGAKAGEKKEQGCGLSRSR